VTDPGAHTAQAVVEVAEKWPLAQTSQRVAFGSSPVLVALPGGQLAHATVGDAENVPGEQVVHRLAPSRASVSVAAPGRQGAQATLGAGEKRPAAQAVHEVPLLATRPAPSVISAPAGHSAQGTVALGENMFRPQKRQSAAPAASEASPTASKVSLPGGQARQSAAVVAACAG